MGPGQRADSAELFGRGIEGARLALAAAIRWLDRWLGVHKPPTVQLMLGSAGARSMWALQHHSLRDERLTPRTPAFNGPRPAVVVGICP